MTPLFPLPFIYYPFFPLLQNHARVPIQKSWEEYFNDNFSNKSEWHDWNKPVHLILVDHVLLWF